MTRQVWILAGQSNMEGFGAMRDVEPPDPRVEVFDLNDGWREAAEPLHRIAASPYPVHRRWAAGAPAPPRRGAGLGLAFGRELAVRSGDTVGLIPLAVRSTSLEDWSPHHGGGGGSLYGAMLDVAARAGQGITGMLWYQGESEAFLGRSARFLEDTRRLFDSVRLDLGAGAIYQVQLGRFHDERPPAVVSAWSKIRDLQRRWEQAGADGFTTAVDLPMDDEAHLGTRGLRRLGARLARLAHHGETLDVSQASADGKIVRIEFRGVTGSISAPETEEFTVIDGRGRLSPVAATARVGYGSIEIALSSRPRRGDVLWYGWGLAPRCSLADESDNGVPAFATGL